MPDNTVFHGLGRRALLALLLGGLASAADEQTFSPQDVAFYETRVKPILDEHCLKCHGGEKTKADLRVTSRGALLRGGDTGPAVDVAKPAASLLLKMINYVDDDHQMPPRQKLPAEHIATLTSWVEKGLPWTAGVVEAHAEAEKPLINDESRNYWAYRKPRDAPIPAVGNAAWVANPIDAFVMAGLDRIGLKPAPAAARAALMRRACYDLTGLPPTAAEVAEFVASRDPKAYEQLIERLLASPQYGEKWGRHWLDVVGYADTNGYERDGDKPHAWRYRDYVVRSFNQDKPYDRFLREQLAGDELPQPDADAITATAYYRLGVWDDEPADREQAKYDNLDGIVSTTSGAMLGMAVGCARCHDHKRDPIAQDDYYRLLAFFHNLKPMNKRGGPDNETMVSPSDGERDVWQRRIADLEQQVVAAEQAFIAKLSPSEQTKVTSVPKAFAKLSFRQYRGSFTTLPEFAPLPVERSGVIAEGLIDPAVAGRLVEVALVFEGEIEAPQAGTYLLRLASRSPARLSLNGRPVITIDGSAKRADYHDAEIKLGRGRTRIQLEHLPIGDHGLRMTWSGPGIGTRAMVTGTPVGAGSSAQLAALMDTRGVAVLGPTAVASYRAVRRELHHLRNLAPGEHLTLSVTNQERINDTHVLARGNPGAKGRKVAPGFPMVLGFPEPVVPHTVAGRRTVLAEWIVHPDNPLTARVLVNRLWQHHFGRGIVATANDFGQLGEQPTNQPLLDWLALQFVARGWSIKAMHRLIMTSNAYRMSSQDDSAALAKDAGNLHLWRFTMRRLTAEEIRDSILLVDGSLNLVLGGPPVFPPMPAAVLATSSKPRDAWGRSPPDDEVRRSLYIKVKRSLVHPLLSLHDFADTDQSCPVRFATTVPTQALTMLNSGFINERAAVFAKRLASEEPDSLERQVALGLRLVTQREARPAEIARSVAFIDDLRATEGLDADGSLVLFCLMALNLNEFVYLD